MVNPSDPHAELGVAPDATQPEIHEAFRRRLRQHHPDTRNSAGTADDRESDETLQRALAAYAALRRRPPERPQRSPAPHGAGPAVRGRGHRPSRERHALWVSPVQWEPAGQTQPGDLEPLTPRPPLSGAITPVLLLRWLLGDPGR